MAREGKRCRNWNRKRLSSLPDALLTDILSYLPIHSAVATSVLSRRWRNLWTHITHPLDLSTLCLKTLCIKAWQNVPQRKFVINASKLEDITLCGLSLPYLRLIKPFGTLYTADVNLNSGSMDAMDYDSYALEFAEMMSTASTLRLNFTSVTTLSNLNDTPLPIFDNLSDLNIEFGDINGSWNDLLLFLRCSPNLQSLTPGNYFRIHIKL